MCVSLQRRITRAIYHGAHQDELVAVELSGPVGFGAVAVHQSLTAGHLVLRDPGGEALWGEEGGGGGGVSDGVEAGPYGRQTSITGQKRAPLHPTVMSQFKCHISTPLL